MISTNNPYIDSILHIITVGKSYEIAVSLNKDTVNVKCTLLQALRLCTGRTAHRGSRGIAILFLDHGTRRG
jgi:hypothetical protein